jgi:hypothetical protein
MTGDDRVRFCASCNLHVYNLAEMNRKDAAALVAGAKGRLCVQLYRRADGTVITRDCPIGLRAIRRRAARLTTAAAVVLATLWANVFASSGKSSRIVRPVQEASNAFGSLCSFNTATISGRITDPNGQPIPKATITLTNLQTNQRIATRSDRKGRYYLSVSSFGEYSLRVEAPSFQKFIEAVELHLSDDLRADVSMMIPGMIGIVSIEKVRSQSFDIDGTHVRIN